VVQVLGIELQSNNFIDGVTNTSAEMWKKTSHTLIRRTIFLIAPTKALRIVSVILLHINHRHVSAIRVVIFKLMKTGIQVHL